MVLVDFDPLLNTAQDTAFRSAYGIDGSVRLFGPWQLGDVLDDGGEKINLELKNDVLEPGSSSFSYYLSDQVVYDDVAPWPVSSDADGDSLHRLGAQCLREHGCQLGGVRTHPGHVPCSLGGCGSLEW